MDKVFRPFINYLPWSYCNLSDRSRLPQSSDVLETNIKCATENSQSVVSACDSSQGKLNKQETVSKSSRKEDHDPLKPEAITSIDTGLLHVDEASSSSCHASVTNRNLMDFTLGSANMIDYINRRNNNQTLSAYHLYKLRKLDISATYKLSADNVSEVGRRKMIHYDTDSSKGTLRYSQQINVNTVTGLNKERPMSKTESLETRSQNTDRNNWKFELDDGCDICKKVCDDVYLSTPVNVSNKATTDHDPIGLSWEQDFAYVDSDINHTTEDRETYSGKIRTRYTKIFDIFRNLFPGVPHSKKRVPQRRLSIDSQMTFNKWHQYRIYQRMHGKRVIKIIRPDNSRTLYFSGPDTLGGLPENDDTLVSHPVDTMTDLSLSNESIHDTINVRRRSSFPGVCENDDICEYLHSSNSDLLMSKHTISISGEFHLRTDDGDSKILCMEKSGNCNCCQKSDRAETLHYFGIYSSGSSTEVQYSSWNSHLDGFTLTVDKKTKQGLHKPNTRKVDSGNEYQKFYHQASGTFTKVPLARTCDKRTLPHSPNKQHVLNRAETDIYTRSKALALLPGHCHGKSSKHFQMKIDLVSDDQNRSPTLADSSISLRSWNNGLDSCNYFSDVSCLTD